MGCHRIIPSLAGCWATQCTRRRPTELYRCSRHTGGACSLPRRQPHARLAQIQNRILGNVLKVMGGLSSSGIQHPRILAHTVVTSACKKAECKKFQVQKKKKKKKFSVKKKKKKKKKS